MMNTADAVKMELKCNFVFICLVSFICKISILTDDEQQIRPCVVPLIIHEQNLVVRHVQGINKQNPRLGLFDFSQKQCVEFY